MKALYVVRHGIAEERDADVEDDARKLTRKGKDRMKLVAKGLADVGIRFDVIMTSPLARALQTARILEKYCMEEGSVEETDLLEPDASFDDLIDGLNRLEGVDSVAIVGHEPFLSGFVSYCLSGQGSSFIRLKKGGVASLGIDGAVKPGQCLLVWLLEPGQLIRL
jgi:phosphohistidine phosphatase